MPRAVVLKTLWGCPEVMDPDRWDDLFARVKKDGFDGVEFKGAALPEGSDAAWRAALARAGLQFVCQVHTCGYKPLDGVDDPAFNNQSYVPSEDIGEHIESFREQVRRARSLGAVLVNSHSGHDAWTVDQGVEFMTAAVAIEIEEGVPCCHETHRRRVLFSPWNARDVLKRVPGCKVNADLSHWCVVMSRVPTEATERCWSEVMALLADRVVLVHARVGYSEGAQVPDPSAPEFAYELQQHERWWSAIWAGQARRRLEVSYIEPEFGPPPYMHTLPHSKARVADLWEVNTWMASRLARTFAAKYGGDVRVRQCADTKPKPGFGDCPESGSAEQRAARSEAISVASGFAVLGATIVAAFLLGRRTA